MDNMVSFDAEPLEESDDLLNITGVAPCEDGLDNRVETAGHEKLNAPQYGIEMRRVRDHIMTFCTAPLERYPDAAFPGLLIIESGYRVCIAAVCTDIYRQLFLDRDVHEISHPGKDKRLTSHNVDFLDTVKFKDVQQPQCTSVREVRGPPLSSRTARKTGGCEGITVKTKMTALIASYCRIELYKCRWRE
jgi:hypothetical protein